MLSPTVTTTTLTAMEDTMCRTCYAARVSSTRIPRVITSVHLRMSPAHPIRLPQRRSTLPARSQSIPVPCQETTTLASLEDDVEARTLIRALSRPSSRCAPRRRLPRNLWTALPLRVTSKGPASKNPYAVLDDQKPEYHLTEALRSILNVKLDQKWQPGPPIGLIIAVKQFMDNATLEGVEHDVQHLCHLFTDSMCGEADQWTRSDAGPVMGWPSSAIRIVADDVGIKAPKRSLIHPTAKNVASDVFPTRVEFSVERREDHAIHGHEEVLGCIREGNHR